MCKAITESENVARLVSVKAVYEKHNPEGRGIPLEENDFSRKM